MANCSGNLLIEGKTENGFGNRRVCIVGAGMSGLLATKYLLSRGLNPTVFEAKKGIGGLWRETFSSTKLQTSRPAFQFTDFPWPNHVTNQFPTHSEVMDYFHRYSEHFGLLDHIQFNSKVVEIRYIGQEYREKSLGHAGLWGKNGGPYADSAVWEVGVQKSNGESTEFMQWHHFEFLVLCIGRYGDMPKIPSFPPNRGPEVFQGKVLHTMDYSALDEKSAAELIKGKKIVVIGIRKSAMDFVAECAEANQEGGHPCTLVFRAAHWTIPCYNVWGVPLSLFHGTRFAQLLLEKPGQGFLYSLISRLFAPMRWAMFKLVELYLIWKLPLRKYGLVPDHSFLQELSSCQISSLPDSLFPKAEEGCILFRKSYNWGFCSKGIVLDDQTVVEADLVVLGTGYDSEKKLKNLLPKIFADALDKSAVVLLYRGLIHPHIPHLAILGYPECLSNLHSTEIRSQWLAHFLSGKFVVPSIKEMEADTDNHSKYMKKITPFYSKTCLDAFQIWDNDTLYRDMGRNPMRKKNWFCELFSPYGNLDYQESAEIVCVY